MADRLTQLQDCLDDLATQMFASLRYINTHHSLASIPGQPDQGATLRNEDGSAPVIANPGEPTPDAPDVFQANLRELARDLVLKEQQIEYLIRVLPGIDSSEASQNERVKRLEQELREVEGLKAEAAEEKERLLKVMEQLGKACQRVY